MKLFAWQPQGHSSDSFFVMEVDEASARQAVEAYLQQQPKHERYANGWGTDYYQLTVAEVGQVLSNENA